MHRDGVDYALVLLIGRRNIQSGVTSIHGPDGRDLGSFTLAEPFDAAWVDDHRVMHGVTPVEPIDPTRPGSAMCWWSLSGGRVTDAAAEHLVPCRPQCCVGFLQRHLQAELTRLAIPCSLMPHGTMPR